MIQGSLFTRDFLLEGVKTEPAWQTLTPDTARNLHHQLAKLLASFARQRTPNEAETESQLIYPVLRLLGWDHMLMQQNQSASGRADVPDALLFAQADSCDRAQPLHAWQRFEHGTCLVEAKRWNRPLDRPTAGSDRRAGDEGVPSNQILRYLRRADDVTHGRLRWGMLTNGRVWRLYWQGAVSVSEEFFEIDLGKLFTLPGCLPDLLDDPRFSADHTWRLFLLIFGRDAFLPDSAGRSFHQIARQQGQRWEEKVARDLSRVVFDRVFPVLAEALGHHDPTPPSGRDAAWLAEVREAALTLLYRLLFILYAEDRDLLPSAGAYARYSLTTIRREIAEAHRLDRVASSRFDRYWRHLRGIFKVIAEGDDALGVPPYNGGLFDASAAPLLNRVDLPDSVVAEIIFALSHVPGERGPLYVNFRDLSVQQLGSVYERILEFGLRVGEAGAVVVDRDDTERHDSGSYYTPEALVSLIITSTVGPLVDQTYKKFAQAADTLARDPRPKPKRLDELARLDPATALLDLRICDPAMGSGHFLVSLVDWLADRVLDAVESASSQVTWADYASPLLARVAEVRTRIRAEADAHRWPVTDEQLDDRHVIRRMILKRVVFGVDKNKFAVELAKVSLWLHTFTVGAPLSFLDHHLRWGDSIVGAWVAPTLALVTRGGHLVVGAQVARLENVAARMSDIEQITDNDVIEVRESKHIFGAVHDATRELDAFFSLIAACPALGISHDPHAQVRAPRFSPADLRRTNADAKKITAAERQQAIYDRAAAFRALLEGSYGDPLRIAAGELDILAPDGDGGPLLPGAVRESIDRRRIAAGLVSEARALDAREHFLHWQVAFPNIWRDLTQATPQGGFDAVIGNPPYVRQERLAAIKPALEAGFPATFAGMADLYVYFFEQGLRLVRPGGRVGYVVTNKWLKAGYAEKLRAMLVDAARAETEEIVDFGHARAFFPGTDVFPNVVVVRRPDGTPAAELNVAVPGRETLPDERLPDAVAKARFSIARTALRPEGWSLEQNGVMDLLEKIRRAGVPLSEYAGVKPLYGIKTGFNEAFLIDTPTRDRLVSADSSTAELIRPYLRGQDVQRWNAPDSGLHMIVLKSSSDFAWPWAEKTTEAEAEAVFASTYPALHTHMKRFESFSSEQGSSQKGLRHRQDHGRFWWELRSCAYYDAFGLSKLIYQVIQFYPSFALDTSGRLSNDKTFILPTDDVALLATLNSPLMWWRNWRSLPHLKDEALSPMGYLVEGFPIAVSGKAVRPAQEIAKAANIVTQASNAIHDWLRLEFGLDDPGKDLQNPERLDADAFAAAVRKTLPRRRTLSAADIARLKREHADTIEPARQAAAVMKNLERHLSDLVNAAYGLTPDDIRLMWQTAPPRMPPFPPADLDLAPNTA